MTPGSTIEQRKRPMLAARLGQRPGPLVRVRRRSQSETPIMKLAVLAVLGVGVLYCLHRLAVWAEQRGWIYYRKKHGSSGTLSSAVLEVQSLLEPSKQYVLEEKTREQVEEEDSGDPPKARNRGRHGPKLPAGVLIGFQSEDDWFEYRLENHPEFLRRIQEARQALRAGLGTRLEDVPH